MERTLRVCLSCGHVGCCESWRGHASAHAEETGHPVIAAWRGGAFAYCYPHRRYLYAAAGAMLNLRGPAPRVLKLDPDQDTPLALHPARYSPQSGLSSGNRL